MTQARHPDKYNPRQEGIFIPTRPARAAALFTIAILGAAAALASACADAGFGRQLWTDQFTQAAAVQADILFVVDNSGTMQEEHDKMVDGFQSFIENVRESETDFHIGVTTTDMDQDGEQGRLIEYDGYRYITADMDPDTYTMVFKGMIDRIGTNGSGWEKGLWAAKSALYPQSEGGQSGEGGYNAGFLRASATLAIIFVSDEDDCSDEYAPLPGEDTNECYEYADTLTPAFEYIADYQALKPSDDLVVASGIIGLPGEETSADCGKYTGYRYIEVIDDLRGILGDICRPEFSDLLSEMGLYASGLQTRFTLSRTPDPESIEVKIDGTPTPSSDGWTYLEDDNAIEFFGDAIPPRDSTVTITYYPLR